MTRVLIVSSLCVLTLAGCGRTVVRETVVERPGPVRETVVEKPVVVERPAVAAAPAACTYAGVPYAHGSLSCQGGYETQCSNGAWVRNSRPC